MAELLTAGGDVQRAEVALQRARTLAPKVPELLFAQGLIADMHGHPSDALDAYLATIEQAAAVGDAVGQVMIEVASYAVLGQSGLVRGYVPRVRQRLTPLAQSPQLSLAARAALSDVLVRKSADKAYRTATRMEPPPPAPTKAQKKAAKQQAKLDKKAAKAK